MCAGDIAGNECCVGPCPQRAYLLIAGETSLGKLTSVLCGSRGKNRTACVRGKRMMVAVRGIIWVGCDICAGAIAYDVKEMALDDWDGEGQGVR